MTVFTRMWTGEHFREASPGGTEQGSGEGIKLLQGGLRSSCGYKTLKKKKDTNIVSVGCD